MQFAEGRRAVFSLRGVLLHALRVRMRSGLLADPRTRWYAARPMNSSPRAPHARRDPRQLP